MASTSNVSGIIQQPVNSSSSNQEIRTIVSNLINSKFANTLGQAYDIVNTFMALIYRESSFNSTNSRGITYGISHLNTITSYSAISKIYNGGTALQKANIINSTAGFGLCQVTGYYCFKGCGLNGKSEIERLRPELASTLTINPGDDITTLLWGSNNIENQILCGLIVLEGKYVELAPKLVSKGVYSNRLTAAVAAYLGLGKTDGSTTPEAYANSIIRGTAYQVANNGRGPDGTLLASSGGNSSSNTKNVSGPAKTVASGNKLAAAGC